MHGVTTVPGTLDGKKGLILVGEEAGQKRVYAITLGIKGRLLYSVAIGKYIIATSTDKHLIIFDTPATLSVINNKKYNVNNAIITDIDTGMPTSVVTDNARVIVLLLNGRLHVWFRTCEPSKVITVTQIPHGSLQETTTTVTKVLTKTRTIIS